MLPGKKYPPEEILRLVARRAGMIAVSVMFGTALAYAISTQLPNRYRSETLIMLLPQRVPDSYVKTIITTKIEDRLASLENQILSRSRLERIIVDLNLYEMLRARLPMEDVVLRMREDITVKVEGKESFRVSYVGQDATVTQRTTERLASPRPATSCGRCSVSSRNRPRSSESTRPVTSSSAPTTRAPTEAVQPNARRKIKAYTLPPDLYKKAHNLNRIRFRLALIGFVYAQLPDVGRSFS